MLTRSGRRPGGRDRSDFFKRLLATQKRSGQDVPATVAATEERKFRRFITQVSPQNFDEPSSDL